jgi:hypothetical protein
VSLLPFLQIDYKSKPNLFHYSPKDKNAELWDGPRTGVDKAPEFFGVDEAYAIDQLSNYISR